MYPINGYLLKRTVSGLGNIKSGLYLYENYIKRKAIVDSTIYKRMEICPWPLKKYYQKPIDPSFHLKENNPPPSSQKN